jgi:hypothetical protein
LTLLCISLTLQVSRCAPVDPVNSWGRESSWLQSV